MAQRPLEVADGLARLERLRARRLAEDERLVCMERARILHATRARFAHLPRVPRQAAILRDLCEQITPVIEPEDILVGRMPEVLPGAEDERWISQHPELFTEPGVPGWLDSLSIYVPDWGWLLEVGLGGIAAQAHRQAEALAPGDSDAAARGEFLGAVEEALQAVALLVRRYAGKARREAADTPAARRRSELEGIAARCERVAWGPPRDFLEALQLLQLVHLALSCLVGGRDVTPGRVDQYLYRFYRDDVAAGRLSPDEGAVLLALMFLRLSQMAGNSTDFDDNRRRSPCQFSHLYVTVGGTDEAGRPAANELTHAVLHAVDLLDYKEPTLLIRWRGDMAPELRRRVVELVCRRRPVTIYNDEIVVQALVSQGVPLAWARGYAHSACHNVLVVGHEAGSGPAGFYNLPGLILQAMQSGQVSTFEDFMAAVRGQVRAVLAQARRAMETRWAQDLEPSCPLLQSALMRHAVAAHCPSWRAAPVSHFNHHLMGLGTAVDSLLAIRRLVFEEQALGLQEFTAILEADWAGHEALRQQIRTRFPRYGQGLPQEREMAAAVGALWVAEVGNASRGMSRACMWPGFYSHMLHVHEGARTAATPDGRAAGQPLSENVSPSYGTPRCSPTSVLQAMAALPFAQTPSGAATLALAAGDVQGEAGADRLRDLIESYFRRGGLHLQVNVLGRRDLQAAMATPERYGDLMVRVTGFSAYFTRLSRDAQEDLLRRYERDVQGL